MELLINKSDVSKHLQTAIGLSDGVCNTYIAEAQQFDLKQLLCEDFFYDLISKRTEADWKFIIDGGDYDYNNRKYNHAGIAKVLAYFTYARLILKANITSTTHGFTIKKTPHSEPISLEERKNFYYNYRKDANTIFEEVKTYLDRNEAKYSSLECSSSCQKVSSFKTRVVQ